MSATDQAAGDNTPRYQSTDVEDVEVLRYRRPGRFWMSVIFTLTVVALALAVNQIFRLGFFQMLTGNVGYRVLEANVRELLHNPGGQQSWC